MLAVDDTTQCQLARQLLLYSYERDDIFSAPSPDRLELREGCENYYPRR